MRYLFLLFFAISYFALQAAPRYNIKGNIINKTTREPIEYASVVLLDTNLATMADSVGHFIFDNVFPVSYHVKSSSVVLNDAISHEFIFTSLYVTITIEHENSSTEFKSVTVTASAI